MKHLRISNLLERRIQKGDYDLSGIPSERVLADDIGVSRVTLRKALEELENKGLLERVPNRRLVLTSKALSTVGGLQLAFVSLSIAPKSFSLDLQLWLAVVESVARQPGDSVRVDCINVQGHNAITQARINEWDNWRSNESIGGELVDEPCGLDENIYQVGVDVARKWIRQIDKETTAVLCVLLPAAMSITRAAANETPRSVGQAATARPR